MSIFCCNIQPEESCREIATCSPETLFQLADYERDEELSNGFVWSRIVYLFAVNFAPNSSITGSSEGHLEMDVC